MRDSFDPYEPPSRHPPLTLRRLAAMVGLLAAFPALLFAIEHPTAVAASLLLVGGVTAAIRWE